MRQLFSTETKVDRPKKLSLYDKYKALIYNFTDSAKLQNLLFNYVNMQLEMCSTSNRTMYANVFRGRLTELSNITRDEEQQCAVVQQSITNGWVHFYELKQNRVKDPMNESGVVRSVRIEETEGEMKF